MFIENRLMNMTAPHLHLQLVTLFLLGYVFNIITMLFLSIVLLCHWQLHKIVHAIVNSFTLTTLDVVLGWLSLAFMLSLMFLGWLFFKLYQKCLNEVN